ncbi:MAG: T9SS type A sorting domain-containing protein [Bacteroidetes bacterium]|nr:T9SS type A sorting domain-containing protein [Bacteroidota bacterium]
MIKKSVIFMFLMGMFAASNLAYSQAVSDTFVRSIGYTPPSGWTQTYKEFKGNLSYDGFMVRGDLTGTNSNRSMFAAYFCGGISGEGYGANDTSAAVTCHFPVIMESNRSYTLITYTQSEIGLNVPCDIIKIRIPVWMDPGRGGPDCPYFACTWELGSFGQISMSGVTWPSNYQNRNPTPIRIYFKNGAEINGFDTIWNRGNQPVDISPSSGWVNVFDGYWDPDYPNYNGQLVWNGISDTATLVLEFETPFAYTGGHLSVVFENRVGVTAGAPSSNVMGPDWEPYWIYRFKSFLSVPTTTTDNTAPYYGPLISYSDHMFVSYWFMYDDGTRVYAGGATPAVFGPEPPRTWVVNWNGGGVQVGGGQGDISNYTFFAPFSYAGVKGPGGSLFGTGTPPGGPCQFNASIRPNMLLTGKLQTLGNPVYATSTVNSGRETRYVMSDMNINMDGTGFKLRLKRLKFTIDGTKPGIYPTARLYYSPTGLYSDTLFLGSVQTTAGNNELIVTTPHILENGDNNFILAYDVPEPTVSNGIGCNDPLVFNLTGYVLGNRENGSLVGDTQDHEFIASHTSTKYMQFAEPILVLGGAEGRITDKRFCIEETGDFMSISIIGNLYGGYILGRYFGFTWDRSTDGGLTWETGVSTDSIYVFPKDYTYNAYRGSLVGPSNCSSNAYFVYNIIWENQNTGVSIDYTGTLTTPELEAVSPGSILTFTATPELGNNSIPAYNWQYTLDGGLTWGEIVGATSQELDYTIPVGMFGNVGVRVRLSAQRPECNCQNIINSNVFYFNVIGGEIGFIYVNQPPANLHLCPNGRLELMVSYSGRIDATRSCWQKDGVDLPYTDRVLTINGLNLSHAGVYRYKAVDTATVLINGDYVTITDNISYSNVCNVNIVQPLEIYYVSNAQNYAVPGQSVGFKVYSSFEGANGEQFNENSNIGFQWYRHQSNGGDVKIDDNYYFKGARSNALVIVNMPEKGDNMYEQLYTFDGAYYYLEITGPCGTANSRTTPIFVNPGEGIDFIKNNTNFTICENDVNDFTATFEVQVQTPDLDLVKYQWYIDGVAAEDGPNVEGSKTPKLTLHNPNLSIKTYCVVSAFVNYYFLDISSEEAEIEITDMELWQVVSPTADLTSTEIRGFLENNGGISISIRIETNKPSSSFVFDISVSNSEETIPIYTGTIPAGTYFQSQFAIDYSVIGDDLQKILNLLEYEDTAVLKMSVTNECGSVVNVEWNIIKVEDDEEEEDGPVISSIKGNAIGDFSLTPNPTTGIINVAYNSNTEMEVSLQLCNTAGSTIFTLHEGMANIGENKFEFDLAKLNLAAGTYTLKIANKKGFITKQFVFVR